MNNQLCCSCWSCSNYQGGVRSDSLKVLLQSMFYGANITSPVRKAKVFLQIQSVCSSKGTTDTTKTKNGPKPFCFGWAETSVVNSRRCVCLWSEDTMRDASAVCKWKSFFSYFFSQRCIITLVGSYLKVFLCDSLCTSRTCTVGSIVRTRLLCERGSEEVRICAFLHVERSGPFA